MDFLLSLYKVATVFGVAVTALDLTGAFSRPGAEPGERGCMDLLIRAIRLLMYFALGFGPAGWLALTAGRPAASLLWSIPAGVASLAGIRALKRHFAMKFESGNTDARLIGESGEVIEPIPAGDPGTVRVYLEIEYVDRPARAADPGLAIPGGTRVRVTGTGENCLLVEPEAQAPLSDAR